MNTIRHRVARRRSTWQASTTISVYRWTGGRLLGRAGGLPVLLLTTTGRRSGLPRTVPVSYVVADGRLVVGGRTLAPAWCANLRADPSARIELGSEAIEVRATSISDGERDRLFVRSSGERASRPVEGHGRGGPAFVLEPLR